MHDIRAIRENPAAFDEGLRRRGLPPASPEILALDADRRARYAGQPPIRMPVPFTPL